VDDFVRALPLKKIPGVGKVTQAKLGKLGLITCQDIRDFGEAALSKHFGSFANHLFQRAWGHDPRRLTTEWIRKSVSVERTFSEDLTEQAEAAPIIERLTAELEKRLTPYASRRIKNQQVKLKFSDFTQTTVERQSDRLDPALTQTLLESAWDRGFGKGVRLIGLGVHFYDPEPEQSQQLALFEAAELQGAP
jgi:DNA polymerase-4